MVAPLISSLIASLVSGGGSARASPAHQAAAAAARNALVGERVIEPESVSLDLGRGAAGEAASPTCDGPMGRNIGLVPAAARHRALGPTGTAGDADLGEPMVDFQ